MFLFYQLNAELDLCFKLDKLLSYLTYCSLKHYWPSDDSTHNVSHNIKAVHLNNYLIPELKGKYQLVSHSLSYTNVLKHITWAIIDCLLVIVLLQQ